MIPSNQRFSALGTAYQSHMVACTQAQACPSMLACLRLSAVALLSSSGFVSVPYRSAPAWTAFCPPIPALLFVLLLVSSLGTNSVLGGSTSWEQWWRFNLYLSVSSLVGGGAGFEPMAYSGGVCAFEPATNIVLRRCPKSVATHHPFLLGKLVVIAKYMYVL